MKLHITDANLNFSEKEFSISGGVASLVELDFDELLSSTNLNSSVMEIKLLIKDTSTFIEDKLNYTLGLITKIDKMATTEFKNGEKSSFKIIILPKVVNVLNKTKNLIEDGFEVADKFDNVTTGHGYIKSIIFDGSLNFEFTAGNEKTKNKNDAKIQLNKKSKFYDAYKNFQEFKNNFTIYGGEIDSIEEFLKNPAAIDYQDKKSKLKLHFYPIEAELEYESNDVTATGTYNKDEDKFIFEMKSKSSVPEEGKETEFSILYKKEDDKKEIVLSSKIEVGKTAQKELESSEFELESNLLIIRKGTKPYISEYDVYVKFETNEILSEKWGISLNNQIAGKLNLARIENDSNITLALNNKFSVSHESRYFKLSTGVILGTDKERAFYSEVFLDGGFKYRKDCFEVGIGVNTIYTTERIHNDMDGKKITGQLLFYIKLNW